MDSPEGISVFIQGRADTSAERLVASLVGPLVAQQEYPESRFGRVLHVEWMVNDRTGQEGFEVVVEANPPCAACEAVRREGFGPAHTASPSCRSGGYDHCTCDTCF